MSLLVESHKAKDHPGFRGGFRPSLSARLLASSSPDSQTARRRDEVFGGSTEVVYDCTRPLLSVAAEMILKHHAEAYARAKQQERDVTMHRKGSERFKAEIQAVQLGAQAIQAVANGEADQAGALAMFAIRWAKRSLGSRR